MLRSQRRDISAQEDEEMQPLCRRAEKERMGRMEKPFHRIARLVGTSAALVGMRAAECSWLRLISACSGC